VSTEDPRHYSAKGSVSIEAIEGTLELGRQGGSSSTVSRYIVTAVDPHLTVSVLLPGAEDDLRSYVTEYVANIATLLGASSIPARYEFLGVWGAYLGRQVVQDIRVEITPNELILGGGEVEVLTVVASARQASDTPALLAIRLTDVSTGLSTISDLIRIDRREPSATGRVNHQQAQAFSTADHLSVTS
jgi:hypothetical protein